MVHVVRVYVVRQGYAYPTALRSGSALAPSTQDD